MGSFTGNLQSWLNVVCNYWRTCRRWTHYHESAGSCISNDVGIPQGDSASPLMLCLLLWIGHHKVQRSLPNSQLYQAIWMDDRTICAGSQALLDSSVAIWQQFAETFHLIENQTKTQWVHPVKGSYMEVLGCIVGQPSQQAYGRADVNIQRIKKSQHVLNRIAVLPVRKTRLNDMGILAKLVLCYGWFAGRIPVNAIQSFNTKL